MKDRAPQRKRRRRASTHQSQHVDYVKVLVRLDAFEQRVARNRLELDLQSQRIEALEAEIERLKSGKAAEAG